MRGGAGAGEGSLEREHVASPVRAVEGSELAELHRVYCLEFCNLSRAGLSIWHSLGHAQSFHSSSGLFSKPPYQEHVL